MIRDSLVSSYLLNRARSRVLFDLIDPDVYYSRPIALRNPIAFYEGHLPAFGVIALLKRGLGHPGVDERLEVLFARGIDPDSTETAVPRSGAGTEWPSRAEILAYGEAADAEIVRALRDADFDLAGTRFPSMANGQAIFTALEHEAMHQETLLYMWRRLPYEHKRKPADVRYEVEGQRRGAATVTIPAGRATLGARRAQAAADGSSPAFGWDNEFDELPVDVPAFDIDAQSVTNEDYLAFVLDRGYERRELWDEDGWAWRTDEGVRHPAFWIGESGDVADPATVAWAWRGMFESIPLPLSWPVYVSQAEASAYARWRGRRLPTEAEYHRAAFGAPGPERAFPWGDEAPGAQHGNFDFRSWEPVPAGNRPAGASAWGVQDLIGNGWEWTSTIFRPFPGFQAMPAYPEYSAEFFDDRHVVMKGASPATAAALVRRSFRNWFRPNYPYVYAKFRTCGGGSGS